jgi:hypothetical protein
LRLLVPDRLAAPRGRRARRRFRCDLDLRSALVARYRLCGTRYYYSGAN